MKKILTALLLCFAVNQIQAKDFTLFGITFEKKAITEELQSAGLPVDQINSFFASVAFYEGKGVGSIQKFDSNYQPLLKIIDPHLRHSLSVAPRDIPYTASFTNLFIATYLNQNSSPTPFIDNVFRLINIESALGQKVFDGLISYFKKNNMSLHANNNHMIMVWVPSNAYNIDGRLPNTLWTTLNTNKDLIRLNTSGSNAVVINYENNLLKITNNGLPKNIGRQSVAAGIALGKPETDTFIYTDKYMSFLSLGSMQGPSGYAGIFIGQCYKKVTIESTELSNVALGIYVQKGVELQLKNVKITTQGDLNAQALQSFKSSDGISISNLHGGIYLEEGAVLKVQNVTVNGNKLPDTV